MNKFYFASLILLAVLLVFIMVMAGCVLCFIDLGSLIMVVLMTFIMLLASFKPAEMGRYFRAAFTANPASKTEIGEGITFFRAMQKYLLLSGLVGMMMGVIAMLAMLGDADKIGKGMALALITVLYAIVLNIAVAIPFRTSLEKRLESS